MKQIILKVNESYKSEGRLVLATVISTKGSTPQKAGSSAIFGKNGLVHGTIGGGILEGKVQKIATESAITGKSGIYVFELDKDITYKEEAICGGQATVLVESGIEKHLDTFNAIGESLSHRKPCLLVTQIEQTGEEVTKIERFIYKNDLPSITPEQLVKIREEAAKLLSDGSDRDSFMKIDLLKEGEKKVGLLILELFVPPPQLIIAGAGHIGRSLSHLGKLLGFEVTVIDDRKEYANSTNIPDADDFIVGDMEKALISIPKNKDTYIVIVTRGHNDDAKALKPCIGSMASYIGMIGSKTQIEKMHRNFISNGWATEDQWAAIHAPVGIDINSKTVEEIAVSIAAELVMVKNRNR